MISIIFFFFDIQLLKFASRIFEAYQLSFMCHEEIIYFRNMMTTHHYESILCAMSMKNRENRMTIILKRELSPRNNFP